MAKSSTIHLVIASHWAVPGDHMSAFRSLARATAKAVEETNDLLCEAGEDADATPANWEARIEGLRGEGRNLDCDCYILEIDFDEEV